MKKLYLLTAFFIVLLIAGYQKHPDYETTPDGVIVRVDYGKGTRAVKLRVVTDRIIQVVASPGDTFSTRKSLMVLPDLQEKGEWKVSSANGEVTLTTSALKANISLRTGEVRFD